MLSDLDGVIVVGVLLEPTGVSVEGVGLEPPKSDEPPPPVREDGVDVVVGANPGVSCVGLGSRDASWLGGAEEPALSGSPAQVHEAPDGHPNT